MWEAFRASGEWPTFQFISATVWAEVEAEPRDIYVELSKGGFVAPVLGPGREFELRDDTRVGVSLNGLMHLRDAGADLGHFVSSLRYLGERAARFRPSAPTELEYLTVTSEELRLALPLKPTEADVLCQATLIKQYAHYIWTTFSGPDSSGHWTVTLNVEQARRFRNVQTVIDFLDVDADIRGNHRTAAQVGPITQVPETPVGAPTPASQAAPGEAVWRADTRTVLIAAQTLEENIEDLRRRVSRALDSRVFWSDLLVWNVFDEHKHALTGHVAYKPVADAYRSLRELNEIVPVPRLRTPIPENELLGLQEHVDVMAHASSTLNALVAEVSGSATSDKPQPLRAAGGASSTAEQHSSSHPTAFITWAHGDADWQHTIARFAFRLREFGVDADVDLFHADDQDVNWATYGVSAIESANFVLIAVSRAYKERWEGTNDPQIGAGAAREANALKALFERDQRAFRRRVKVVLLPGASAEDVPAELFSGTTRFPFGSLDDEAFETLLRTLTDQPAFPVPPVGAIPVLPPSFAAGAGESDRPSSDRLRDRLEELEARLGAAGADDHAEQSRLATEHRTVEAAIEAVAPDDRPRAGTPDSGDTGRPAIYGSTTALLSHLQRAGAQTDRQLEVALGDIDQIGPVEIAEWTQWAERNRTIIEIPDGGCGRRWALTDTGRRVLAPSADDLANDQRLMAAAGRYNLEPLSARPQQALIEAIRDSIAHYHRTFEQILAITGLEAAELRSLFDRGGL